MVEINLGVTTPVSPWFLNESCVTPEAFGNLRESIFIACRNSMYLGILIGCIVGGLLVYMYCNRKSFDQLKGD